MIFLTVVGNNIQLYVKGDTGSYQLLPKTQWTISKDQFGRIAITFQPMFTTHFIKIHCNFDDRNADRTHADKAEFTNVAGMLVKIYQRVSWREEYYDYDAMGNRKTESVTLHSTDTYSYIYYPNSNRLMANGRWAYIYDENGNLVEKGNDFEIDQINNRVVFKETRIDREYWQYEYDLLNRLVSVRKNGQTVASYVYDPNGLRIEKTSCKGTIRYVYNLAGEVILKINFNTQKESRYIYVLGKTFAREDILADGSKKKTYFHTDIQGNIMQATDEQGKILWKRDFLPFEASVARTAGSSFALCLPHFAWNPKVTTLVKGHYKFWETMWSSRRLRPTASVSWKQPFLLSPPEMLLHHYLIH